MDWERGDRYGNVEDRRGMPLGVAGGGIGALALGLLGYFFFGINPLAIIDVVNQVSPPTQQEGRVGTPGDRTGQFVDTICRRLRMCGRPSSPRWAAPTGRPIRW